MNDPFLPLAPPVADNRRRAHRVFIPARVVLVGPQGRVEGRVLDASASGLRLELAGDVGPDQWRAQLEGWVARDRDLTVRARWVDRAGGDRVLVGVEAEGDLSQVIDRERAAYGDLDRVLARPAVDVTALGALAARSLAEADGPVSAFIARYNEEVSTPRAEYLWGWVLAALDLTALPGGRPDLADDARAAKFLGVLLDVVLDDIADGGASPEEVAQACDVVFRGAAPSAFDPWRARALRLGRDTWREILHICGRFPQFERLQGFLAFDYRQLESAMHYAALLNRFPFAANTIENTAYQCHNMHMVASGTIDLMTQPRLAEEDMGPVRELLYYAQLMGRVGNAVTTWPREIVQRDFTSSFFAALSELSGVAMDRLVTLSVDDLRGLEHKVQAERALLQRWLQYRDHARQVAGRVRSLAAHAYVDGLEQLLFFHLASRGQK